MKTKVCSIFVILLVLLIGCALNYNMTPKKVGVMANETYIKQYDDYLSFFNISETGTYTLKEGVSENQKTILRKRRKLLTELDDLTDILNTYLVIGYLPPGQTLAYLETEIIKLKRELED